MEIRNNLFFEKERYCVNLTFGGSQIIQPNSPLCGDCAAGVTPSYLLYDDTCYLIDENGNKITL